METKKCPHCFTDLPENTNLCPKCGVEIKLDETTNEQIENANVKTGVSEGVKEEFDNSEAKCNQVNDVTAVKSKTKMDSKKKAIIVAACGLVFILFIIGVITRNANKINDNNYNSDVYANSGNGGDSSVSVGYISDRTCSYYEKDKEFVVFFGLQDYNNKFIEASGTAKIVIEDNSGNILYDKEIQFTPDDFSDWSFAYRDESRHLCGLHISIDDIKGGASTSGVLTLTVTGDNYSFDPSTISINNLPSKSVGIKLPSTPAIIKNYDYKGNVEFVISIDSITLETESNYDGKSTARFTIVATMKSNNSKYSSSYTYVGYKLKDSSGIVVSSGKAMVDAVGVGERVKADFNIYDLDPNDSYTLTFMNPEH